MVLVGVVEAVVEAVTALLSGNALSLAHTAPLGPRTLHGRCIYARSHYRGPRLGVSAIPASSSAITLRKEMLF